jgi:hypothetical protein
LLKEIVIKHRCQALLSTLEMQNCTFLMGREAINNTLVSEQTWQGARKQGVSGRGWAAYRIQQKVREASPRKPHLLRD